MILQVNMYDFTSQHVSKMQNQTKNSKTSKIGLNSCKISKLNKLDLILRVY